MKTLMAIPLMLLAILTNAQDKRFTLSIQTELADRNTHNESFDYGFNLGSTIEYQMTTFYFDAGVYVFPGLNDIDYFHFQATLLGLNWHNKFDTNRVYIGIIRPGFIIRDGGPHALMGFDGGFEHYFKTYFLGVETGWDWKEDSKIWGEEGHGVWFLAFKIGVIL